jgi:preprotein translocase subunit SecA
MLPTDASASGDEPGLHPGERGGGHRQAAVPLPPRGKGRLGPRWRHLVLALLGLPSQRRLARAALRIERLRSWEEDLGRLTDAELLKRGQQLRGRARGGEALDRLLPEAFGAVCVAARRTIGLRPFDVQLAGGVVLHHGGLAELATGEGKTLVAALPVYLNALTGQGVHVTTVNDYLARRDAEWVGPIYQALGLTVGVLQSQMEDVERTRAYRCDITYGTASEFGFDFLRDQLRVRSRPAEKSALLAPWSRIPCSVRPLDPRVQRGHQFALVDEADNVFVDEARTPLVIGGATQQADAKEQAVYQWADRIAQALVRDRHYVLDEKRHKLRLTREGRQQLRWSNPPLSPESPPMAKLHEHVERALHAHYRLRRDQHYLVENDKVEIVDEGTGRRQPDRHWSDGLHEAVQAKEGLPISQGGDHAARITYQAYFRLYKKLAGMTGTAAQNWLELRRVYKLWVVQVPTNRPVRREQWPDRVLPTEQAKFDAVVAEVRRLRALNRPTLIGTRSVERSEMLSACLRQAGIEHQVLNARYHEYEAELVAQAGQAGRVTIATNMAGRGTDIKLGPGVADAGGLHVLGTERHEAVRIDRQLAGRAGRQGDPGSCQFFLSLEDELLEALGPELQEALRRLGRQGGARDWQEYHPLFLTAQRLLERRHYRQRVDLLLYEKQRQEILKDLGADPYVD